MVNVKIDGTWHQFPKGTRLIEACEKAGKYVPRYCYHQKLSSPGNCRMCLIEMGMPKMGPDRKPELGPDGKPVINWMPRPQISCAQDVSEGMGVRTHRPWWTNAVAESWSFSSSIIPSIVRSATRRANAAAGIQRRVRQPILALSRKEGEEAQECRIGPRVTLDDERCILCSRCIRFCQEIVHDDVLGFIDRGSHTVLTAHPGKRLENNYSLNTVDICPVGALTSTDFRFKMRVWFFKETKSFCTSCATGCNTLIGTREDVVYRQTPRENDAVNSSWMCDFGRLNFDFVESEKRLLEPRILQNDKLVASDWKTAIAHVALQLRHFSGWEIALVRRDG